MLKADSRFASCGPPSAVEAKGGTARLAPRQFRTVTAASKGGVPQTRDARSADRHTAVRKSLGDIPSLAERTLEHRSKDPAGKPHTVPALRTGKDERKLDADTQIQTRPPRQREPAAD
jgi:hypothetical protein